MIVIFFLDKKEQKDNEDYLNEHNKLKMTFIFAKILLKNVKKYWNKSYQEFGDKWAKAVAWTHKNSDESWCFFSSIFNSN